eukprot:1186609-Prorocentrum_minimum.AAC.4
MDSLRLQSYRGPARGLEFLDVARPPSRDPPPGDRLPGGSLRSDGPEIRPGVGARPGHVKEGLEFLRSEYRFLDPRPYTSLTLPGLARRSDKPSAARPGGVPEGVGGRRPRIVKETIHHLRSRVSLALSRPPTPR